MKKLRYSIDEPQSKICLKCALRKLSKQPEKPCGDCLLLNVDPLARVRALGALPLPILQYVRP